MGLQNITHFVDFLIAIGLIPFMIYGFICMREGRQQAKRQDEILLAMRGRIEKHAGASRLKTSYPVDEEIQHYGKKQGFGYHL